MSCLSKGEGFSWEHGFPHRMPEEGQATMPDIRKGVLLKFKLLGKFKRYVGAESPKPQRVRLARLSEKRKDCVYNNELYFAYGFL